MAKIYFLKNGKKRQASAEEEKMIKYDGYLFELYKKGARFTITLEVDGNLLEKIFASAEEVVIIQPEYNSRINKLNKMEEL